MGPPGENGGWPEHLHFQLSRVRPETHDMPGVVDPAQMITTRPDYFEHRECMHMLGSPREGAKAHGWCLQVLWNTLVELRPLR